MKIPKPRLTAQRTARETKNLKLKSLQQILGFPVSSLQPLGLRPKIEAVAGWKPMRLSSFFILKSKKEERNDAWKLDSLRPRGLYSGTVNSLCQSLISCRIFCLRRSKRDDKKKLSFEAVDNDFPVAGHQAPKQPEEGKSLSRESKISSPIFYFKFKKWDVRRDLDSWPTLSRLLPPGRAERWAYIFLSLSSRRRRRLPEPRED